MLIVICVRVLLLFLFLFSSSCLPLSSSTLWCLSSKSPILMAISERFWRWARLLVATLSLTSVCDLISAQVEFVRVVRFVASSTFSWRITITSTCTPSFACCRIVCRFWQMVENVFELVSRRSSILSSACELLSFFSPVRKLRTGLRIVLTGDPLPASSRPFQKTLPKAQRTRGLSLYRKFLHKSWSNFNSRISIKHQLHNLNQTSVSQVNVSLKSWPNLASTL